LRMSGEGVSFAVFFAELGDFGRGCGYGIGYGYG
jgi:hypothetical protein